MSNGPSPIQDEIQRGLARVGEINTQLVQLEREADAHEASARDNRLKMANLKLERESLRSALGHQDVINQTHQARDAAVAAQQAAEATFAQSQEHLTAAAAQREQVDKLKSESEEHLAAAKSQREAADKLMAELQEMKNSLQAPADKPAGKPAG